MNDKAKAILVFVCGLIIGSVATFIIVGKITQRQFAERYAADLIEQAVLAGELRANKQEEVAKRIESRLPDYVLAIHQNKELQNTPNAQQALWRVKEFYVMNSIAVPDEIAGILNELPPEPPTSCCIK